MSLGELLASLTMVPAAAAPLVLASLGETLSERAGVINLSLNGAIILSGFTAFATATASGSLTLGFLAGALTGALLALVLAYTAINLRLSQLAVGFVLALLARDLAYFLGAPLVGQAGPSLSACLFPGLANLPLVGGLFFRYDLVTYLAVLTTGVLWYGMNRSGPGLILRGLGENPAAIHARGGKVNRLRFWYLLAGGALSGLAGPAFTLGIKAGWKGSLSGLDGMGWIALAVVIFGGWQPLRVAAGALLFALLQWLGIVCQPYFSSLPGQILQAAPFPLMIFALAAVHLHESPRVRRLIRRLPPPLGPILDRILRRYRNHPPAALGQPYPPVSHAE